MDLNFIFTTSAFKHGVTEEDIVYVFSNIIHRGTLDGLLNKYVVIGTNRAGNPIEIFYNVIDDDTVRVFHAMRCRNITLKQLCYRS